MDWLLGRQSSIEKKLAACHLDPSSSWVDSACTYMDVSFDDVLGLKYLVIGSDRVQARLEITDKLLQPWGIVHGGVYCSIIESVASISGQTWLQEHGGGKVVGVNNNTDFLRAVSSGTVTAVSSPVHRGRLQQLWLTIITDENDRVVARGQVRLQNLPPD